ncbi:MAG TPA: tRNA pseudouridine(13) synthase TruD [Planctomycetaceae bacterium]|nr:tRNA pseudouridine(13) synthase TruD [Planctomycetaceae bacterium]
MKGLTGLLKVSPEDFVVEELPAYDPGGAGEHLFLWIEKRDVAAEQLTQHVAKRLEIAARDIGVAGMKDRRAVTRQWISVPAKCRERLAELPTPSIQVLRAELHGNKLRTGHLRGNRFDLRLRDVRVADDGENIAAFSRHVAEVVGAKGFPNYFGEQRFGRDGETWRLGLDLLTRKKTARDIPYSRRRFLFRLALSAVQSDLFNQTLAARLRDGLLDIVLKGDVMEVVPSGGKFVVEDAAAEQSRFDVGEVVTTGPMFGPKMRQPTDEPAAREAAILEAAGLTPEAFHGFGDELSGTRRPYLVRPGELVCTVEEPTTLRLQFTLPAGVYATTMLREWGRFELPMFSRAGGDNSAETQP